ncbi:DNA replication endonuclease-helicase Dna2, partial [Coemansia sp. RSA 552]
MEESGVSKRRRVCAGEVSWLAESPRGTLRSALQQRTAADDGTRGIVQQILDGRSTAQGSGLSSAESSDNDDDDGLATAQLTPVPRRRAAGMRESGLWVDRQQLLSGLLAEEPKEAVEPKEPESTKEPDSHEADRETVDTDAGLNGAAGDISLDDIDIDALMEGLEDEVDSADMKIPEELGKAEGPPRYAHSERCVVLRVSESEQAKEVRVFSQTAGHGRTLVLRGAWRDTAVTEGDWVSVVGSAETYVDVTGADTLVIVDPDELVSATQIAAAASCARQAVVRDRVREDARGVVMVVGNVLHDVFQNSAEHDAWGAHEMDGSLATLIKQNASELWGAGSDEAAARAQASEVMPAFRVWAQTYQNKDVGGEYSQHRGRGGGSLSVKRVLATEENIWAPALGLKGKIDATVVAQMSDGRALLMPLELKTGRVAAAAHCAQVTLYTLLLAARYGVGVEAGLLYYPRRPALLRVERLDDEVAALVRLRNTVARHVRFDRGTLRTLPPMLGIEHRCTTCPQLGACFVLHSAVEHGNAASARVSSGMWQRLTGHIRPQHAAFLRRWLAALDREESAALRLRAELWTAAPAQRVRAGLCLRGLRIDSAIVDESGDTNASRRHRVSFVSRTTPAESLLTSLLAPGDPVVVSSGAHVALAIGFIEALDHARITVAVDRPVRGLPRRRPGFDYTRNHDFANLDDFASLDDRGEFYIDKDEMTSAMSRVRASLLQLFVADGCDRLRRLVVDLAQPAFAPLHKAVEDRVTLVQKERQLNSGQTRVLRSVLGAADYSLVLGMPGTGKTTTIAELVAVLVALGKSVLLASYTHIAVDNILLKLVGRVSLVRLGARAKIHPRIVPFMPPPLLSVAEMDRFYRAAPVVATTCLGLSHPLFAVRTFDYVIVDEASQITLPICLGPLLKARRFVLVGDHHQLPPLVRSSVARDSGLGTSLFRHLCEAHPLRVVRLDHQFRMSADIQRLSNALIYDGHLRCGSLRIAQQRIAYAVDPRVALRSWPFVNATRPPKLELLDWSLRALDPAATAVFLDTDALPYARECRPDSGDSVANDCEARIVCALVSLLAGCGIEPHRVGVLSPYRAQLRRLEIAFGIGAASPAGEDSSNKENERDAQALDDGISALRTVDLHTIDRYQGRDADVIVISFVRSNPAHIIGELLRDWHRINVAITRARLKLIM